MSETKTELSAQVQELHNKIKESGIQTKLQNLCGLLQKPQFKRILVTPIEWDAMPLSGDSGLILENYITSKGENERAERENSTFTLQRYMIIAVADDCRPEFIPGVEFIAMKQTHMGYTTKMTIPHADGNNPGVADYYIVNEHDVMSIILEDRTVQQKSQMEQEEVPAWNPGGSSDNNSIVRISAD